MKKKILINVSLLVAASIIITFILMNVVVYQRTIAEMKISVESEIGYVKEALQRFGDDYLTQEVGAITESRITLIGTNGEILFETLQETGELDNHSERPEVREAFQYGVGSDLRTSSTMDKEMFYYAVKLDDGRVLRMCRATSSVFENIKSSIGFGVVLLLLFIVVAIMLTEKMAKRLVEPINRLNLNEPLVNVEYEELSPLLVRIHEQNRQIREQMQRLKQNQEEYLAITEHMKDGLIITNQDVVLSINRAAQQLFGVAADKCLGRDIITVSRNKQLREAFQGALSGTTKEYQMELGDKVYQVLSNPVWTKRAKVTGIVILILDVTEKQRAEQMRREFTANVSHELKTPLMSISGYAEIIQNGIAKPEDIGDFAGRIYSEANHLRILVEDIIHLSRLDEESDTVLTDEVDLLQLALEIKERLAIKCEENNIDFKIKGEAVKIRGAKHVLDEMIYNLCDNAIAYNKPGGVVQVAIDRTAGAKVGLEVKDSGIGIPKDEQARIFERFYRVDKSHSRKTGGTGLGLAIVKRGALLHDAQIVLESEAGKGTKIQIVFKED